MLLLQLAFWGNADEWADNMLATLSSDPEPIVRRSVARAAGLTTTCSPVRVVIGLRACLPDDVTSAWQMLLSLRFREVELDENAAAIIDELAVNAACRAGVDVSELVEMIQCARRPHAAVRAAIERVKWLVNQPDDFPSQLGRTWMPDELADLVRVSGLPEDVRTVLNLIEDPNLTPEARSEALRLLGWLADDADLVAAVNDPEWEEALVTLGDDATSVRELAAYERAIRAETKLVTELVSTARAGRAANVLWLSALVFRFEPSELGAAAGDEPVYVPMHWGGLQARRFRLRRHRWRYTRMRAYLRELQSELRGAREWIPDSAGEKLPSDWGWSQKNPNRAAIVRELRAKGVIPITEGSLLIHDDVPVEADHVGRAGADRATVREFRRFIQLHGLSTRAALMLACRRNVPSSMALPSLPVLVAHSPRASRDRAADYSPAQGPGVRPAWRPPRPRGGWEEWPIGRPHRVQSDFWPYHASKTATAHWLGTLPSDRRKRRHRGQFSDPDLAFVTKSREHQEKPSREWPVGSSSTGRSRR